MLIWAPESFRQTLPRTVCCGHAWMAPFRLQTMCTKRFFSQHAACLYCGEIDSVNHPNWHCKAVCLLWSERDGSQLVSWTWQNTQTSACQARIVGFIHIRSTAGWIASLSRWASTVWLHLTVPLKEWKPVVTTSKQLQLIAWLQSVHLFFNFLASASLCPRRVPEKRKCGWYPLVVLAWSRTGPCEKILWRRRSCFNPRQEVLALRSWRCSALVLVWNFYWDAHREFLPEDLVRSFI